MEQSFSRGCHDAATEELITGLITVRGIDRWTADMYLMFQLRRLDVWPVDDLGVRQGYALAWQLDPPPTSEQLEPPGDRFRPYRSIVARYSCAAVPCSDRAAPRPRSGTPQLFPTRQGGRMSTKIPEVVTRYFERDTDRDIDSIVSLFADDATVIDEGETRHGTTEIRAWQTGAASKYTYTTEITSTEALGPDRYLVTGRLTGNFPGGVADLKWDFTIAGHHITQLVIAP
jgi:hypothetical protein